MPNGFYQLKVDKIIRETEDAVSIQLLVPPPFKNQFEFKAGQYLTFHKDINGEDVRRSYSVCVSPFDNPGPAVAVKEVPGGKMSTFFNRELKEGDLLDVMPPMGKFVVEPEESVQKSYFLIGGGSGITPLRSIAETVLKYEPKSKIVLLYANRDEASIIFKKDLEAWEAQYGDRFKVIHALDQGAGWEQITGQLSEGTLLNTLRTALGPLARMSEYFICGPTGLMDLSVESLKKAGIEDDKIHVEYFTAKSSSSESAVSGNSDAAGVVEDGEIKTRTIKVILNGDEEDVTVEPDQTVLEAAQDAGMDPPYSCTVGVCTTCRAKLKSGLIKMDEREGLSDGEIEDGWVLTCQSHPMSDGVELEYD